MDVLKRHLKAAGIDLNSWEKKKVVIGPPLEKKKVRMLWRLLNGSEKYLEG